MKKLTILSTCLLVITTFLIKSETSYADTQWKIQSIDTMKFSRDMARSKLHDASFDATIDLQVRNIASTGANYVAIDTPYDAEFLPYLQRWVAAARKYHLHIWFRGNFSGWEQWFGYKPISQQTHIVDTRNFIMKNPDLFKNGDIFSSCPECENGGPGDPRKMKNVQPYRQFLIREYQTTQLAFQAIHKNVQSNFFSMNGDVARLVMNKPTTKALGGLVVIDHYVKTPDQLACNLQTISQNSGGQIMLGEFGAPIPDIQGTMTEQQQANWIQQVLEKTTGMPRLIGLNYWTNVGGSTALWNDDESPRKGVQIISSFFNARVLHITTKDEFGNLVGGIKLTANGKNYMTDDAGQVILPYLPANTKIVVSSKRYKNITVRVTSNPQHLNIKLSAINTTWWQSLIIQLKTFLHLQ